MTDLTTTPNLPQSRPTSPVLSPGLSGLLARARSRSEFCAIIRIEPGLAVEIAGQLPAMERAATGHAGESGVKAVIARRFALYPQPPRSEGEWAEWWAAYVDVLVDTPLASLEAAMRTVAGSARSMGLVVEG